MSRLLSILLSILLDILLDILLLNSLFEKNTKVFLTSEIRKAVQLQNAKHSRA